MCIKDGSWTVVCYSRLVLRKKTLDIINIERNIHTCIEFVVSKYMKQNKTVSICFLWRKMYNLKSVNVRLVSGFVFKTLNDLKNQLGMKNSCRPSDCNGSFKIYSFTIYSIGFLMSFKRFEVLYNCSAICQLVKLRWEWYAKLARKYELVVHSTITFLHIKV